MRVMKLALVALFAATTLVPALSPEASARDSYRKMLSQTYNSRAEYEAAAAAHAAFVNAADLKAANARAAAAAAIEEQRRIRHMQPRRYRYSRHAAAANQAAVNAANANAVAASAATEAQNQAFINEVNAQVAAGKITLFEGNAILIRGHF